MVKTETWALQNSVCAGRNVLRLWLVSSFSFSQQWAVVINYCQWAGFHRLCGPTWGEWVGLGGGEEYWTWTVNHKSGNGLSLQVVLPRDMTHFGITYWELKILLKNGTKWSLHIYTSYFWPCMPCLGVSFLPWRLWIVLEGHLVHSGYLKGKHFFWERTWSSNFCLLHQGKKEKCMHCRSPN